jgi:hypothetical protein
MQQAASKLEPTLNKKNTRSEGENIYVYDAIVSVNLRWGRDSLGRMDGHPRGLWVQAPGNL